MGSKRIYLGRETGKYAEMAGGAILTIATLFFILIGLGFQITGTDDFCLGTLEDPCISYGEICNRGPDNYDIYNPDSIEMDFSPEIKNYWIFFKDGRVKKEFLIPKGVDHSTVGWRFENFTNATKPRKDRVYVHRFPAYKCQDYMLVGLKENPNDLIKWGMGISGKYLDPIWYPDPTANPRTLVEGWEDPPLGALNVSFWENWSSTDYGRIQITGTGTPHAGSYHLLMDSSTNGQEAKNAVITQPGLFTGAHTADLSFWHREYGEEDDDCPVNWTGGYNSGSGMDCVAFTCDNVTWFKLVDLAPAVASYTFYEVNITAHANWCGTAGDNFRIMFAQDDNYAYSTDGMAYDDINITIDPPEAGGDLGLLINGTDDDVDVEVGETVNITGLGTGTICLSGDHPDMGTNFSCGSNQTEFLWEASGGILDFNDSSTEKNYTFTVPGCMDYSLNSIRNNSDVLRSLIDITGYNTTQFPKDVKLDIDGDGVNETVTSGELRGTQTYLYYFNDSSTTKEFYFNGSQTQIAYIKLPQGKNVTNASLIFSPSANNYQGFEWWLPRTYPNSLYAASSGAAKPSSGNYQNTYWIMGGDQQFGCNNSWYWTYESITVTEDTVVPYQAGVEALVQWVPNIGGYEGFLVCGGYDTCVADAMVKSCYFRRINPFHPTKWVSLTDMPSPMAYMGWVAGGDVYNDGLIYGSNDTVYAFGGSNDSLDSNDNCWKYNMTADSWSTCTAMPRARGDMFCEWVNTTHIVCTTGWFSHPANSAGGRYTEVYDTVGDSWTEHDTGAGTDNYLWGTAGFRIDGNIYKAGGLYSDPYHTVYQLDADFGDWTQINLGDQWPASGPDITYGNCDEFYDGNDTTGRAYCWSSGYGWGMRYFAFYVMPHQPLLQVGNYINDTWSADYDMAQSVNITDFSTEINEFVNDCDADAEGYCTLPLYIFNNKGGNITIESLNITTDYNNIDLNWSTVTCASDYCNKTLRICSDQNGSVEVSNINITYEGTKAINVSACNATACADHWLNVYHSKYERTLPYDWTDTIFFLPTSANESNVTAYGQTSSVPIINLTGLAQDKNFTVALQWNNSLACVNMTFSNSSSKSNGFFVSNSSFTQICSVEQTGSCSMWAWADLNNCNASASRYINPTMEWKSCCDTCMSCGW